MPHAAAHDDRRRYPRHQTNGGFSVELRVEVSGDKPAMLLTRGVLADISYGGLKCDIDLDVPVGTRVDVRFPNAPAQALVPPTMVGRVVRTDSVGGVPDQVAIVFAKPLEQLDSSALNAAGAAFLHQSEPPMARGTSWSGERQAFSASAAGSLL